MKHKYRAFINGVMIDSDDLAFEEYDTLENQLNSVEFLMQYTNKKDVGDTEVYGGDIVEWKDGDFVVRGVVEWDDDFACFQTKDSDGIERCLGFTRVIKIIGNIYENPELVGENND